MIRKFSIHPVQQLQLKFERIVVGRFFTAGDKLYYEGTLDPSHCGSFGFVSLAYSKGSIVEPLAYKFCFHPFFI